MKQNFRDVQYVVRAQVTAITDSLPKTNGLGTGLKTYPPFSSGHSPTLAIKKIYKGPAQGTITLSGGEFCSEVYELHKEYILFIYKVGHHFFTRICEHNFLAEDEERMATFRKIAKRYRMGR